MNKNLFFFFLKKLFIYVAKIFKSLQKEGNILQKDGRSELESAFHAFSSDFSQQPHQNVEKLRSGSAC